MFVEGSIVVPCNAQDITCHAVPYLDDNPNVKLAESLRRTLTWEWNLLNHRTYFKFMAHT